MLDKIHRGLQGDALGRCHVQRGPDISFPWLYGVPARLHRQLAVCHLGQRLLTDAGLPMGHQEGPVCPISGAEYPGASGIFSGFHWRPGVPTGIQLQGKNSDIRAPHDRSEQLGPSSKCLFPRDCRSRQSHFNQSTISTFAQTKREICQNPGRLVCS